MTARAHLNRIIVLATLAVALPSVAATERLRPGRGQRLAVGWVRLLARACSVRVEVRGAEHVAGVDQAIVVPNHTSPADVVALLLADPGLRFVGATEIFDKPLLGTTMRALGTVPIQRGDIAKARAMVSELSVPAPGRRLVIFPEGKIAYTPEVLPFLTGPFAIAIRSGAVVVPVAISGAADVLPHHGRNLVRPGRVTVEFLPPIPTDGLPARARKTLAVEARDRIVEALDQD